MGFFCKLTTIRCWTKNFTVDISIKPYLKCLRCGLTDLGSVCQGK